jgi:membrane protein
MKTFFKGGIVLLVQRFYLTLTTFNRNGLSNHASAGAYAFLLSLAPTLIIIAFVLSRTFVSNPETAAGFIAGLGLIGSAFDSKSTVDTFLSSAKPGITGLVSLAGMIWTARIFAQTLQRGLRFVFTDSKASAVRDHLVMFSLEFAIILFAVLMALSAQVFTGVMRSLVLPALGLGLIIWGAYRFVPKPAPGFAAVLWGAGTSTALFSVVSLGFRYFLNPAKYDVLYGTLGNLILLLVNVYFFFVFFYIGAELVFVIDSFDALLFSKVRQVQGGKTKNPLERRLFSSMSGSLMKYRCSYKSGEVVFYKGDERIGHIHYLLSGKAGVYLTDEALKTKNPVALIEPGSFFGEMAYLLSESRSATIAAETDIAVMALPPSLFDKIIRSDPETDRAVLAVLSTRLKTMNTSFL